MIPKAATFELQDRVFVYKIADGIATAQEVDVRNLDARHYVVDKGVAFGDVLVAEGVGLLREGTAVTPVFPETAAEAAGTAETVTEAMEAVEAAGQTKTAQTK